MGCSVSKELSTGPLGQQLSAPGGKLTVLADIAPCRPSQQLQQSNLTLLSVQTLQESPGSSLGV